MVIPYSYALEHGVLLDDVSLHPIILVSQKASADVARLNSAISEIFCRYPIEGVSVLPEDEWNARLEAIYGGRGQLDELSESVANDSLVDLVQALPDSDDLLDNRNSAPAVRIVNALLSEAIQAGASDIHLEAYERVSVLRFRIDGILREISRLDVRAHSKLISRIKIMAEMDIAEKRLPQDGRIATRLGSRGVDVRVSTIPSAHGERCVMRILEKSANRLVLSELQMPPKILDAFRGMMCKPNGLLLVTGPTGSGKTTTLYAALHEINARTTNIMTVEDPVEYEIAGIAQTQIKTDIGLTFADALRAILRQDPDVIMVGEIRDVETARIALQASFTGHLVIATLHSNSAAGAIARLTDIGVDPYLLSSSLLGVLAQRLVRRVCHACDGRGCSGCGVTGFDGRVGVFELMEVTDELAGLIHGSASRTVIEEAALRSGMEPLTEAASLLVSSGVTTTEEVARVLTG